MPATFITKENYKTYVHDKRLNMIIQEDDTLLDDAEETAESVIKDALYSRYDVDAIFDEIGTARHRTVVKWTISLALYYLYERIPDKLTPDRVIKNYDDTLNWLQDIADGKKSVNLPQLTKEDGGLKTKFRWGSNPNNRDMDSCPEDPLDNYPPSTGGLGWVTAN